MMETRRHGNFGGFAESGLRVKICRDIKKHFPNTNVACVFDVGANVGEFSKSFGQEFPNATIYAFEPVNSTFEILVDSVASNSMVRPVQRALGSHKHDAWVTSNRASTRNHIVSALTGKNAKVEPTHVISGVELRNNRGLIT